jgi:maltose alpha-D-glucosyltransferase/alpha-amylase
MRKECPEIGWGACQVLSTGSPNVLGLACTWRDSTVVTLHNFVGEAREVKLTLPPSERGLLTDLLGHEHSRPDGRGVHHLTLGPYGWRWFRVGRREAAERTPG